MMTKDQLPKPTAEYRAWQKRLGQLQESAKFNINQSERDGLMHKLRAVFALQFWLTDTKSIQVQDLESELRDNIGCSDRLFDHTTFHKTLRGNTWVYVTQPYAVLSDLTDVIDKIEQWGCCVADLTEWGFYFPGQTICIGVAIGPKTRKRLAVEFGKDIDCDCTAEQVFAGRALHEKQNAA